MLIDFSKLNQPKPDRDPPVKINPVSVYAQTAAVVGILVFVLLCAGSVALAVATWGLSGSWSGSLTVLAVALTLSVVSAMAVAAILGIRWTVQNVTRSNGPILDRDLDPAPAPVDPSTPLDLQPIKGPEISAALWTLLAAHYIDGQKTTRSAAGAALDIGPDVWNRANKLFLAAGVKSGTKWTAANFESAAKIIRQTVLSIDPDGSNAWIRTGQNSRTRIPLDPGQ